jgi:hypothetical protein
LWLSEKLKIQIETFEENPKCNFIYTNSYIINEIFNTKRISYEDMKPEGDVLDRQLKEYSVSIPTVLFHKSLLYKVSYWFDPNYSIIEEFDLFIRMFVFADVKYISTPLAVYRVHGNNTTGKNKKLWIDEVRQAIAVFSVIDRISGLEDQSWKNELEYAVNRNEVIYYLTTGQNCLARKKIKSILRRDRLAPVYYLISILPSRISIVIYNKFAKIYTKKTIYS